MQPIMKICGFIMLALRRRKSSYHYYLTKHPLGHKVIRTYRIFSAHQCLLFLTLIAPIYFVMKICYKAYRWIFSYYFHTLISLQPRTIMSRDAENFHHVLHRCITPWQKIPFFICISSTTIIYGSHVIRASPKSSHYFGTYEPSLLLRAIFSHHFARLSYVILKFLLWI